MLTFALCFVLRFRYRVRLNFAHYVICPSPILSELSITFDFIVLYQISLFRTDEIVPVVDFEMILANQNTESVASLLLLDQ